MSPIGVLVLSSSLAVVALVLVASGAGRITPSLAHTVRDLHRGPSMRTPSTSDRRLDRIGAKVIGRREVPSSTLTALRLLERPAETHVGTLVLAAAIGAATPTLLTVLASQLGVTGGLLRWLTTVGVSLLLALVFPAIIHAATMEQAAEVRTGLRHQLSAFVDVVTMLLAGNAGHEGALRVAADAGDGQLFRALRRRMREVSATGHSLVDALDLVADDYRLPELAQIAGTARLAAAQGAPVSRSLAAKCGTLRSSLATDQEAEARVRIDKVTPPLVGMTLLFMAVIIYPALDL